jgi:ribosomal protein S18 acetylase RimI-like enzyme
MQTGKVVYLGKTKKGTEIVIRYPKLEDGPILLDFINPLSKEQTFIRFQGEQLSLEDETNWLNGMLDGIQKNKIIMLVVEHEGRIIGDSTIALQGLVESHIGLFGITVTKDFRGQGIGRLLMELVVKEAIENLPQLRIIILSVFANNPLAKQMYQQFGFVQYGDLPEGILHKGQYINHEYMYKKIR